MGTAVSGTGETGPHVGLGGCGLDGRERIPPRPLQTTSRAGPSVRHANPPCTFAHTGNTPCSLCSSTSSRSPPGRQQPVAAARIQAARTPEQHKPVVCSSTAHSKVSRNTDMRLHMRSERPGPRRQHLPQSHPTPSPGSPGNRRNKHHSPGNRHSPHVRRAKRRLTTTWQRPMPQQGCQT